MYAAPLSVNACSSGQASRACWHSREQYEDVTPSISASTVSLLPPLTQCNGALCHWAAIVRGRKRPVHSQNGKDCLSRAFYSGCSAEVITQTGWWKMSRGESRCIKRRLRLFGAFWSRPSLLAGTKYLTLTRAREPLRFLALFPLLYFYITVIY